MSTQPAPSTAPTPAPRVLIVRNHEASGPGRLPDWLTAEGLAPVELPGAEVPGTPAGYQAVVLLGGGFLPDDDARYPWLARERELARQAVAGGVPLLGICLGAQLLAAAHGGTVLGDHGTPERGSHLVTRRPGAAADRLLAALPDTFPVIQSHRDQITQLPPGAVHLAESARCPVQAFRLGERAWGVQFHPEVGAERLAHWDPAGLAADGLDLPALRAEAEAREPAAASAARRLVAAFAAVVREHATAGRPPADGSR
ncbi:type 1 glutamine amidotransferase [Streptomyces sp. DSM 44915]|uniref:Type 1 glutamine amidotransferase n=1 Tax=Streptomyces chisholmiae TaxID=3075540 RepID=A0ABU2JXG6_9ACTN|nr:type 1 glutamine amidotransferase [Streptomyces sp. DSM 44915]MDT0269660.1 type 1 glutamine amidotransferase [Streptomyces sp. DSM 44915]